MYREAQPLFLPHGGQHNGRELPPLTGMTTVMSYDGVPFLFRTTVVFKTNFVLFCFPAVVTLVLYLV